MRSGALCRVAAVNACQSGHSYQSESPCNHQDRPPHCTYLLPAHNNYRWSSAFRRSCANGGCFCRACICILAFSFRGRSFPSSLSNLRSALSCMLFPSVDVLATHRKLSSLVCFSLSSVASIRFSRLRIRNRQVVSSTPTFGSSSFLRLAPETSMAQLP
jgi:hypothetical protein